jgi:hypothetical protein
VRTRIAKRKSIQIFKGDEMKKSVICFVGFPLLVLLAACGRLMAAPVETAPSLAELRQVCLETLPYTSQRDCGNAALMGQYTYAYIEIHQQIN